MAAAVRARERDGQPLATSKGFRSRSLGRYRAAPKYAVPSATQAPAASKPGKEPVERRGDSQRRGITVRTATVCWKDEREEDRRQNDPQDEQANEDQREDDRVRHVQPACC